MIPVGILTAAASGGGTDPSATAFFNRVTSAGGTLTTTEQNAVNTLVLSLKANNLWALMKAIYPMVGASAASCSQNLVSSSFTGSFIGGWTFSSNGVTGNGTTGYMDTNLNPFLNSNINSKHLSYYSRNNFINCMIGVEFSNHYDMLLYIAGAYYDILSTNAVSPITIASSRGYIIGSRTSFSSGTTSYVNNTNIGTAVNNASLNINKTITLNRRNSDGVYSNNQCAYASIGDGLTSTEASNLYTIVQTFQTSLSRQV